MNQPSKKRKTKFPVDLDESTSSDSHKSVKKDIASEFQMAQSSKNLSNKQVQPKTSVLSHAQLVEQRQRQMKNSVGKKTTYKKSKTLKNRVGSSNVNYTATQSNGAKARSVRNKLDDIKTISPQNLHRPASSVSKTSGYSGTNNKSSRSSVNTNLTNKQKNPGVIVAVIEGRGAAQGEIGMASMDLRRPVLELTQFSDSVAYRTTLAMLRVKLPDIIVFPNTIMNSCNKIVSKLYRLVESWTFIKTEVIRRTYFSESYGIEIIKYLCHNAFSSVLHEINGKYYALSAASALIRYAQFVQSITYRQSSMKIVFTISGQTLMMDLNSIQILELVENNVDKSDKNTLYSAINYTLTSGGARLLRTNLLQPPFDLETVLLRQSVVDELVYKPELVSQLSNILSQTLSLDRFLSLCIQVPVKKTERQGEDMLTNVLRLKQVLNLVPSLKELLASAKNPMFSYFLKEIHTDSFQSIMDRINQVIYEEVNYKKSTLNMHTQNCFAIKTTLNGHLDVSRISYSENIDDISRRIFSLSERFNLPLRTAYNGTRGFHIQVATAAIGSELPEEFIKVKRGVQTTSCTTTEMLKLNERAKLLLREIYEGADIVISNLITNISPFINSLYTLSEVLNTLDMLQSIAKYSRQKDFARPDFTETMAIINGRNPIIEKCKSVQVVPNHTFVSSINNFVIITGPNMSGKSTYLRQVCLLQILAQIGCYVPCDMATFRLTDHIFTRMIPDDNMEWNTSSFGVEMVEVNFILNNVTRNSLLVVDELCRATSAEEGIGLCFAICEELIKSKAFVFVATHFHQITHLAVMYPRVTNYHFQVTDENGRDTIENDRLDNAVFTHHLVKGRCKISRYGLKTARLSCIPPHIVDLADRIADKMDSPLTRTSSKIATNTNQLISPTKRIYLELAQEMKNIFNSHSIDFDAAEMREYLKTIQKRYADKLRMSVSRATNGSKKS